MSTQTFHISNSPAFRFQKQCGMDAEWIREQLKTRERSQRELADHLGLTEATLSKAMNGHRRFTADEADSIRRFLGYPVPGDSGDPIVAQILDRLAIFDAGQKRSVALYMKALLGEDPSPQQEDH